jgi:HIV Tat-specific factor 1
MTVKFRDPLSAQACVLVSASPAARSYILLKGHLFQKMDGRFFEGRRIAAELYSGKQRFKRSGAGEDIEEGGEDAEKKRLDDFALWLLTEGD